MATSKAVLLVVGLVVALLSMVAWLQSDVIQELFTPQSHSSDVIRAPRTCCVVCCVMWRDGVWMVAGVCCCDAGRSCGGVAVLTDHNASANGPGASTRAFATPGTLHPFNLSSRSSVDAAFAMQPALDAGSSSSQSAVQLSSGTNTGPTAVDSLLLNATPGDPGPETQAGVGVSADTGAGVGTGGAAEPAAGGQADTGEAGGEAGTGGEARTDAEAESDKPAGGGSLAGANPPFQAATEQCTPPSVAERFQDASSCPRSKWPRDPKGSVQHGECLDAPRAEPLCWCHNAPATRAVEQALATDVVGVFGMGVGNSPKFGLTFASGERAVWKPGDDGVAECVPFLLLFLACVCHSVRWLSILHVLVTVHASLCDVLRGVGVVVPACPTVADTCHTKWRKSWACVMCHRSCPCLFLLPCRNCIAPPC